jgi:linoleoyl-CoA desaturase
MKVIKYSKKHADFTQELRTRVKDYFGDNNISTFGNWEIMVKTMVVILIYLVPLGLVLSGLITFVPLMLLCFIVMGVGMAVLGMATMHDANHGSFSKHKFINRMLGKTLYLLGGFPPNWRFQHNTLHHGYPNVEGHDEDIASKSFLRFSPHQPLVGVQRFQHIYAWFLYSLMTISWITTKDFAGLSRYKKMDASLSAGNNYRWLLADLVFSKIIYYTLFLILPIVVIPVAWYWVLLGFLLMHQISGLILTIIFQTAHVVPTSDYPLPDDNGELSNSWTVHQLYTTSNFAPKSRIFSWFIGGLNYQVEHHLFPNISHVHYRKIASIVKETALKYNLPYHSNPSFIGAVRQHFQMLKTLGRQPVLQPVGSR